MGGGSGGGKTTQETTIPEELRPLVETQTDVGVDALRGLQGQLSGAGAEQLVSPFSADQLAGFDLARGAIGEGGIIPEVTGQLQQTAGGDFLFGGPGFDQAVQASLNLAQPQIASAFGGAGGAPGGLASAALQQVASDSFARLFNQERARQQQAQLALPQLGLIPSDVLANIGGQQQALAQRQLTAPISANEALIAASGGGVPLTSLLGQTQRSDAGGGSKLAGGLTGGLGGAATGAALGSVFPGIGTGVGALVGGGIGLFGGLQ